MSDKIKVVKIGELPIADELRDGDELVVRDSSKTQPEDQTARVSIATLRAAMGGPAEDWSEYPATQDVDMAGHALVGLPQLDIDDPDLDVRSAANVATVQDVSSRLMGQWASYPASQDVDMAGHKLTGLGEPTEGDDAATKAYVDAQAGGGGRPGHIIATVSPSEEPAIEPLPQRANLVFTGGVDAIDFEDLDSTLVNIREQMVRDMDEYAASVGLDFGSSPDVPNMAAEDKLTGERHVSGVRASFDPSVPKRGPFWQLHPAGAPDFTEIFLGSEGHWDLPPGTDSVLHALHEAMAHSGASDRIESDSGDAFVETTDDFFGMGNPGTLSRAKHAGGSAVAYTAVIPSSDSPGQSALLTTVGVVNADESQAASFAAQHDPATGGFSLRALGAPLAVETPTSDSHAATKAYVDSRPSAESWSEYAATQGVELGGHKIIALGEPESPSDAATKSYVDTLHAEVPEKIGSGDESASMVAEGGEFPGLLGTATLGDYEAQTNVSVSEDGGACTLAAYDSLGNTSMIGVGVGAPVHGIAFTAHGSEFVQLNDPAHPDLPTGIDSVVHAAHIAKEAHTRLPDVEWWDPVWAPVVNVDSVNNVECQCTRAYRAAGGSLVTIEGTITVTPEAAGQCAVQVTLPVARFGSGLLAGTAMAMEVTPPGHVAAVASVSSTALTLGFVAEGPDPYLVGFRASYRAA